MVKKSQAKNKSFDKTAFVFEYPIEVIEEAIKNFEKRNLDVNAEPFNNNELYWFAYWVMTLPKCRRMGIKTVPVCAQEAMTLGLYKKSTKRKKK